MAKFSICALEECRRRLRRREERPKILVYTDSRGFDVTRWYCRKNAFRSYVWDLGRRFEVYSRTCPHTHTTLLDFLVDWNRLHRSVDAILLHVGVVDFSPRPLKSAQRLREVKLGAIRTLFGDDAERQFALREYDDVYDGEFTASLYSPAFLRRWIIPAIAQIDVPVIWMGVNPVVAGWRGNYFRDRPPNMNVVQDYQEVINESVPDVAVPIDWSDEQVQEWTVDNVHLSESGFQVIGNLFRQRLATIGLR